VSAERRTDLPLAPLIDAVRRREPAALGRAVSLIESTAPADRVRAGDLLTQLGPASRPAVLVGISGVPGVGKSTFIDSMGARLLARGHHVAVLAVDPSSTVSGGSILGDKTRMQRLAGDPRAYVRPSPTAGTLGGVAPRTPETIALCEAAGFDVIIVETVGVGQSETSVADLADVFLVLMLPGGGDELQGIKRGLMERADVIAVNKADGAGAERALATARDYRTAMQLMRGRDAAGPPPVLTCSALDGTGLDEVWAALQERRLGLVESGVLAARRREQRVRWMWAIVEQRVRAALETHEGVHGLLADVTRSVADGSLPPSVAAERLLRAAGLA
jgi:LAO/AO transport system kinase